MDLEAPEVTPGAAVPDLHLVGDDEPACGAHGLVDLRQVARWNLDPSGVTGQRFGHEGRWTARNLRDDGSDGIGIAVRGIRAAVLATIEIGQRRQVDPRRPRVARVRVVVERRRDLVGRCRPAVVPAGQTDGVLAGRDAADDAQGEVDGFAPRVDEEHGVERLGQQLDDALCVGDHAVIAEPRVRVEQPELPAGRSGDPGIAVPDDGDIVDHVEVGPARGVDQVVTPAAFDAWRVRVVVLLDASHDGVAPGEELVAGVGGHVAGRHADERRGVRGQRPPGRGNRRLHHCSCSHTGGRQLHVNVGR